VRIPFKNLGSNVTPDHNNYSLFGNARKDSANKVTHLSAQIGQSWTGQENFDPQQHRKDLLEARLNTFLDVLHTPSTARKETVGPFDAPYLKIPLISARNTRVGSGKSFNENRAFSKVTESFLQCDAAHRADFLKTFLQSIHRAEYGSSPQIKKTLVNLYTCLSKAEREPNRVRDLETLQKTKKELEDYLKSGQGKGQIGINRGEAKRKLKKLHLREVTRDIAAIEQPSSYERHLAKHEGRRVNDRPLYIEEIKNNSKESVENAPSLKTQKEIQSFTQKKFQEAAGAFRAFQASFLAKPADTDDAVDAAHAAAKQSLDEAIRPILYSKDRKAMHRFIHDMTRQLKRLGLEGDDAKTLEKLQEMLSSKHSHGFFLKMLQTITTGTGKQMRREDKAERMAQALPDLLQLSMEHHVALKNNLMAFDAQGCMMTSDEAFWEREAIDKIMTSLTEKENSHQKTRIFKQMTLRAGALGMDTEDVPQFMAQGIDNTLSNRNMAIQGAKIGAKMGAVAGNIASTPLTKPMMAITPALALPGVADSVLMPIGAVVAAGPGAAVMGGVMSYKKKSRLKEAKTIEVEPSPFHSQPALSEEEKNNTYTSASKKLVTKQPIEKPTLKPVHRSFFNQLGRAGGEVSKDIGGELWGVAKQLTEIGTYAFYKGPRNAYRDLVRHRGPQKKSSLVSQSTQGSEAKIKRGVVPVNLVTVVPDPSLSLEAPHRSSLQNSDPLTLEREIQQLRHEVRQLEAVQEELKHTFGNLKNLKNLLLQQQQTVQKTQRELKASIDDAKLISGFVNASKVLKEEQKNPALLVQTTPIRFSLPSRLIASGAAALPLNVSPAGYPASGSNTLSSTAASSNPSTYASNSRQSTAATTPADSPVRKRSKVLSNLSVLPRLPESAVAEPAEKDNRSNGGRLPGITV
jgi:hypothetical protein